jgi:hypothetical protein
MARCCGRAEQNPIREGEAAIVRACPGAIADRAPGGDTPAGSLSTKVLPKG